MADQIVTSAPNDPYAAILNPPEAAPPPAAADADPYAAILNPRAATTPAAPTPAQTEDATRVMLGAHQPRANAEQTLNQQNDVLAHPEGAALAAANGLLLDHANAAASYADATADYLGLNKGGAPIEGNTIAEKAANRQKYYDDLTKQFAAAHPVAAKVLWGTGAAGMGLLTGGAGDLAAAGVAGKGLIPSALRIGARYLPATGIGGAQGYANTPEGAGLAETMANTLIGAGTGAALQGAGDLGSNLVNRYLTGRLPSALPVIKPALTGTLKTAATGGLGYAMHHMLPYSEGGLVPLGLLSHKIGHALVAGPEELATAAGNVWRNARNYLSTPTGAGRLAGGGRFVKGVAYPPVRSAIPAAAATPYAAGATTPSALAGILGEWAPGGP